MKGAHEIIDTEASRWNYRLVFLFTTVLVVAAVYLILRFGTNVPIIDEWDLVPDLLGVLETGDALRWLDWSVARHNEHRYPVARFLFLVVMAVSGPDLRSGMLVSVLLLTLTTWGFLKATRVARGGGTSLGDAVIPALLLSWGHAFNLLMGYQIAFTLHAVSVAWLVWSIVIDRGDRRSDLRSAFAVACLPLSGGLGLASAVPACGWLLYRAWANWSNGRGTLLWHTLTSGVTILAAAVYAVWAMNGVESTTEPIHRIEGFFTKLTAAGQFLAIGNGIWIIDADWFTVILVTTGWHCAVCGLLAWAFVQNPAERVRALGLFAVIAGIVLLALAVGWGRSGGLAERYATPAALGLATSWVAVVRFNPFSTRRVLPLFGLVVAVALVAVNIVPAMNLGGNSKMHGRHFTLAVKEGLPPFFLANRFYCFHERMRDRIATLGEKNYPGMRGMAVDQPRIAVPVPAPAPTHLPACDAVQFYTARPSLPIAPPPDAQPVIGFQIEYELDHDPVWLELHLKWTGSDGETHISPVYIRPSRGRRTVAFWVNDVPRNAKLEPACVTLGVIIHRAEWLMPK